MNIQKKRQHPLFHGISKKEALRICGLVHEEYRYVNILIYVKYHKCWFKSFIFVKYYVEECYKVDYIIKNVIDIIDKDENY